MNKTKIDWADSTWNPVTGCLHDCPYCYARWIARRFEGGDISKIRIGKSHIHDGLVMRELSESKLPYPFGFDPTFHRYRLSEPSRKKKPQTIFVGSMCDLFGEWVPDEWIKAVFDACAAAPWHRYLFLTKNPGRYQALARDGMLPQYKNFMYGSTATTPNDGFWWSDYHNTFVSIEPIMASFDQPGEPVKKVDWVIVGAETGNRKGKVVPKREWIETLAADCKATGVPVFMKESLRGLMGMDFVQEFPWECKA